MLIALLLFQLATSPEKPLFDGKTLKGWHVAARPADQGKTFWTVRDGEIVADSIGHKDHDYVWLVSDREYGDFDLVLEVKSDPTAPGNSGIQVRSRYDSEKGWMHGPQIDIHPPTPWRTGLVYDETYEARRWVFPSLPDWKIDESQGPKQWKWHADGWNEIRIACNGTLIRTWVNGYPIADYDGKGHLDNEAHRKRNAGLRGHIALQLHAKDEVRLAFRNIRIRTHNR
ncbi:MAG: DUF1080 domain-containing protein [Bryobacteraceae bacterium]|nr:DUF1080 domain-containing protein [Bryobacteraceae bacterium]